MSKEYGLILPNKGHINWAPSHLRRFQNKGILEDRQEAGQSTNRELSQKTPPFTNMTRYTTRWNRKRSGYKKQIYRQTFGYCVEEETGDGRMRDEYRGKGRRKAKRKVGEQFKDKESFVTSAYKPKLQELRERVN
ncbi:hypothetical protein NQ317_000996 [Molorchus minor]|uniref:Nuclear speckle splicing regulatory protein 1 N-terminal domain-containing protein n=1 Tax=Molorchus minor TaxID=1323400 RepID=A0ABQ9JCA2_9CUCU|nr:hypothetical protein NQ317_000996 [Molorchus minor]